MYPGVPAITPDPKKVLSDSLRTRQPKVHDADVWSGTARFQHDIVRLSDRDE